MADELPRIELSGEQWMHVEYSNDLTLYWGIEVASSVTKILPQELLRGLTGKSLKKQAASQRFDGRVSLILEGTNTKVIARANIVRSHSGKQLVGTFRVLDRLGLPKGAEPQEEYTEWPDDTDDNSIPSKAHGEAMFGQLFGNAPSHARLGGTVIISGGTGSGKSSIGTSLVKQVMRFVVSSAYSGEGLRNSRLPHVVTVEDPIENWGIQGATSKNLMDFETAMQLGVCFTPREIGRDVQNLDAAILDAKRQTPRCFYVGEVRDSADWRSILSFGASGHLVIVTTHAGSIRETVSAVLAACSAETPALRRQFFGFVRGVIHVRSEMGRLFPAMWLGAKGSAINSLVSVGLSSVAPNNDFCLGRRNYYESNRETFLKFCAPAFLTETLEIAHRLDIGELRQQ